MEYFSPWFHTPADHPVRVGVYEVLAASWTPDDAPLFYIGVVLYCYWTGTCWLVPEKTVQAASRRAEFPSDQSPWQDRWWRGLTEDYAQSIAGRITNG